MTRRLEIEVDKDTCISAAFCVASAPANFELDDDRRSQAITSPVEESPEVWEALEGCPVEAISARDAETGERLFPPR